jgi:6-pyruvoyltetrahydropterin/6-carboxytetrahydropterin synthase
LVDESWTEGLHQISELHAKPLSSRSVHPIALFIRVVTIPPTPFSCSKLFEGYSCCHRQWSHEGHCRFVHGYSRSFTLWFGAQELDSCGFVVDFSSLRPFEQRLREQFDHTFLANADDPLLAEWRRLDELGALDLRVMDNVGMEATAALVWAWANELLQQRDGERTCCWAVEARENRRNAATYTNVSNWF